MKKINLTSFLLTIVCVLSACTTTPANEEPMEWEITNKESVLIGCEQLQKEVGKENADC
jgi:hypothetical protein